MNRIFFYSDESGQKSGGRFFIVAGVAIEGYHNEIRSALRNAEGIKRGIGKLDWHGAKDQRVRRGFLEAAFDIPKLRGRVFYRVAENTRDYWGNTVATLLQAVQRYGNGKRCIIAHEGFTYANRLKLKRTLEGETRFEVRAGSFKEEFIRLADRLAGFLGVVKFGDPVKAGFFSSLDYGWFVDLGK